MSKTVQFLDSYVIIVVSCYKHMETLTIGPPGQLYIYGGDYEENSYDYVSNYINY